MQVGSVLDRLYYEDISLASRLGKLTRHCVQRDCLAWKWRVSVSIPLPVASSHSPMADMYAAREGSRSRPSPLHLPICG